MAEKLDLKKALKHLYSPSAKNAEIVDVPTMNFLMIDGQGNPNTSPDYQAAVEALYGTAYTLKFACKNSWGGTSPSCRCRGCGGVSPCMAASSRKRIRTSSSGR